MANSVTSTGYITNSWDLQSNTIAIPPSNYQQPMEFPATQAELQALYAHIDHLEQIISDFEGRLEELEEKNG